MAEPKDIHREQILTQDGFKKLQAKLDNLKTHQRREVADRIRQAKEFGEIGENSEYEDAKAEQAFIENEILNLENTLRHAKVLDESDIHTDIVSVGSVVALKELDSGVEVEYQLVGTSEADPAIGQISDESPVGAALKDQKKNTVVEVRVPDGIVKYKILRITRESKDSKAARRGK
jgi:transcription elongation factor GreA